MEIRLDPACIQQSWAARKLMRLKVPAVAGQLGSTWGDMGRTVRGKIEGHTHLLGCQRLLFVFLLAQRFLFYSVPCHLVPTVVHSVLLFLFVFVLVSNFCAN